MLDEKIVLDLIDELRSLKSSANILILQIKKLNDNMEEVRKNG